MKFLRFEIIIKVGFFFVYFWLVIETLTNWKI